MPLLPFLPRLQPAVLVPLAASLTVLMTAFAAAKELDPGAAFFTDRVASDDHAEAAVQTLHHRCRSR